jgi:hypothetical protein
MVSARVGDTDFYVTRREEAWVIARSFRPTKTPPGDQFSSAVDTRLVFEEMVGRAIVKVAIQTLLSSQTFAEALAKPSTAIGRPLPVAAARGQPHDEGHAHGRPSARPRLRDRARADRMPYRAQPPGWYTNCPGDHLQRPPTSATIDLPPRAEPSATRVSFVRPSLAARCRDVRP